MENTFKMKSIPESKLKAFSIGRMNIVKTGMSKKDKEEMRKKEEEKKTAEVYSEFVASFEGDKGRGKAFVRGDVINPDEKTGNKKGKLYKPTSKLQELVKSFSTKPDVSVSTPGKNMKPDRPTIKKKDDKKKSNLELFKEELKIIQAEREQRHAFKKDRNSHSTRTSSSTKTDNRQKARPSRFENVSSPPRDREQDSSSLLDELVPGSHDSGDPMTTNLFLGNVNPKMDEQMLCGVFGKYGPLASVKIMWPRTEEERSRERNCAFVAFMTRKNAEKAMKNLQGKMTMDYEMKLGWGKTVPIPPHPIYVPPIMLERTLPPPPSGLPFNAQPKDPSKASGEIGVAPSFRDQEEFEDTLAKSVVRVVIPTERSVLVIIHRMIEFVVREGPMFEAMIMNREINNPMFRFLFENQSPAHIYYRWRMYSILQGETATKWRTQDFRLFEGGSMWRPPPINPYEEVMSDSESGDEQQTTEVETKSIKEEKQRRQELKDEDRDKLEEILRGLLPTRQAIAEAMVFCLEHSDAAEEIVECIAESLSILQTPLPKKIARLYLISDVLYNCSAKVANASFFRKHFQAKLQEIMSDIHSCHANIQGRLRAEQFKQRVMYCFRAWEDWAVYHEQFLISLQNTFLGLHVVENKTMKKEADDSINGKEIDGAALFNLDVQDNEVDGIPIDAGTIDNDVDGLPIEAAEDIDGIPLETKSVDKESKGTPRFVQSKWETVDPQDVEAQAMTTSKWDQLENKDDVDGVPLDDSDAENDVGKSSTKHNNKAKFDPKLEEEKRAKLREIEVKVMKFQDDLESGRRAKNPTMDIAEQVEQYRIKLMEREKEKAREQEAKERRNKDKKDKKKTRPHSSSSGSSSESGRSSPHKKRKRKNRDSTGTPRRGLVAYDSDGSTDSSRHTSSSRKRKTPKRRSRSRERQLDRRYEQGSGDYRRRSRSRSPMKRSKRSRSIEDKLKKKRRSRH
ncbi:U2 snRNP-associated SURP motif-containing protein-like isoform X2 [Styela clava]